MGVCRSFFILLGEIAITVAALEHRSSFCTELT